MGGGLTNVDTRNENFVISLQQHRMEQRQHLIHEGTCTLLGANGRGILLEFFSNQSEPAIGERRL